MLKQRLPRSFRLDRVRLKRMGVCPAEPRAKPQLEDCRMEMANILSRKKIQQNKAKQAIDQTLDIAASHAMEGSRRERYFENRAEAKKGLDRLIKHLDRIEQALSKLTPSSQAKLNKIMAEREWRSFDTEIFAELIQAMMDAKLSPARVADEARSAMSDASLKSFNDPVVYSIPRTAPPAILDLWEIIPAETR